VNNETKPISNFNYAGALLLLLMLYASEKVKQSRRRRRRRRLAIHWKSIYIRKCFGKQQEEEEEGKFLCSFPNAVHAIIMENTSHVGLALLCFAAASKNKWKKW